MGQNASLLTDNMNLFQKNLKMKNTSPSNASSSLPKVSAPMETGACSSMSKAKLGKIVPTTMCSN